MYPTFWQLKNRLKFVEDAYKGRFNFRHHVYVFTEAKECFCCIVGALGLSCNVSNYTIDVKEGITCHPLRMLRDTTTILKCSSYQGWRGDFRERQKVSDYFGLNYLELRTLDYLYDPTITKTPVPWKKVIKYFYEIHCEPYLWMLEIHKPSFDKRTLIKQKSGELVCVYN